MGNHHHHHRHHHHPQPTKKQHQKSHDTLHVGRVNGFLQPEEVELQLPRFRRSAGVFSSFFSAENRAANKNGDVTNQNRDFDMFSVG